MPSRPACAPVAAVLVPRPASRSAPAVAPAPGDARETFVFRFHVRCPSDEAAAALADAVAQIADGVAAQHGLVVVGGLTWRRTV